MKLFKKKITFHVHYCACFHFIEIKIHPGTSESESDQLNIIGGKILFDKLK